MRLRTALVAAAACTLSLYLILPLRSQQSQSKQTKRNPAGDWPMWAADLKGTKFSTLKQITPQNAGQLKQVWMYRFNRDGKPNISGPSGSELYQEVTPIVVNGIMYTPAGDRVVALDPETGKEIWTHELPEGDIASFRGVAYWPGDRTHGARVLFTSKKQVVALTAANGKIDPGFGKEGRLDIELAYSGVPTIVGNLMFLGTNFFGPGMTHIGPQLDQRGGQIPVQHGYDVITGKELWSFNTFPQPGEVGHDTWRGDDWKDRTGNNVWAFTLTVDEKNGLLYLPISGPGANYYGGDRPGANLFGNSLVAVDLKTGKYKWHYQFVHHELWDYNLPPSPSLIDIQKDGKTIQALAQVGKHGYMFILDRVTGKPVYEVKETPVTKSLVPKEVSYPTQPIPVKPPPIARVSMTRDDVVKPEDTTPEHSKACLELWDKNRYYNDGPYTSYTYHEEGDDARPAIIFPGTTGGANWGGTAVDPNLGYIFVNTKEAPMIGWLVKNTKYDPANPQGLVEYVTGRSPAGNFSAPILDKDGKSRGTAPCFRPPWGRLIAVNAKTGDFAWEVPLGLNNAMPEGKENAGSSNSAGGIATGGGLFFLSGGTSDKLFRAYDSRTGKQVWSTELPYVATAMPMTYAGNNGKQYVAIVAASGGAGGGGGAAKGKGKGKGDGAPAPQPLNNHGIYVFALP
jgi:quinoprotein glucose dehydrogenase